MSLIGRDAEVVILDHMLKMCAGGAGGVVVITGPVAVGKSALVGHFGERARSAGARLLLATGSRSEQSLPLGILEQLFLNADLAPADVEHVTKLLADGARRLADTSHAGAVSAASVLCGEWKIWLWKALRTLADDRPLVICIDDANFADMPSVECLVYLVSRLRSTQALLVLVNQAHTYPSHSPFHADLFRQSHCRVVELAPLSVDDTAQVLAGVRDRSAARSVASTYHRFSGGNPLLLQGLVQDNLGQSTDEVVVGQAFAGAVVACLHRCSPTMQSAARALAMLGEPAPPKGLGPLLALDSDVAIRVVEALDAAGLLDDGGFRHEVARQAVLDDMQPGERTVLHGRIARLLYEGGAAPSVIARHLVAGDDTQESWVSTTLHDAAEQSLADNEGEVAVRYLRRALELALDDGQRATIASTLARAEWLADPVLVARHLPYLVASVQGGRLAGRRAVEPITYLLWHGRTDEAVATLRAMLPLDACLPELPGPADSADPDVVYSTWMCCLFANLLEQPPVDQAGAESRAGATGQYVLDRGSPQDAMMRAEQILQDFRLDSANWVAIAAALATLVHFGRVRDAHHWCSRMVDKTATGSIPTAYAFFSAVLTLITYRQGRLDAAREHAAAALKSLSPESWGAAIWIPLAGGLLAATARGDSGDAARYAEVSVPSAFADSPLAALYLRARGMYHLAIDDPHAALADFRSCGALMATWGADQPALLPWRSDAAEACLRLGHKEEARELVHAQLAMVGGNTRVGAISLRLLAATEPVENRCRLLEEAVRILEKCDDLFELALACADLSASYYASGRRSPAKAMDRRANRLARTCGAGALRPSLSIKDENVTRTSIGAEAKSIDLGKLTLAERRVATLAGDGHTNQQIASILHITTSTVEQHLTRIYRKLDVQRRTDLWTLLSEFR